MLVAIKLYLKHVLELGVKGNYQIFPVESRGIDFVGYVFRHDYIRVRKGIKNSCRKRIRHSNNLAGITLRVAESIVEKSLIYIRQRKFVKGIEE